MLDRLLKAQHWHLFVTLIGGVFVFQIVMVASISNSSFGRPPVGFYFFPIFMALILYVIFGWQYAIITKLKNKVPSSINIPFKRINTFFWIPTIYFMSIMIFMSIMMATGGRGFEPGPLIFLVVPIHLFCAFCVFHTMFFAAKIIKCTETRSDNTFNDFAGEFFFIWFWPIGIWFLQPRLNKIVNNEIDTSSDILDDVLMDDLDD